MRANSSEDGDPVTAALLAMLDQLSTLADTDTDTDPTGGVTAATRIDRIALLEKLRGAVAAAQHTEAIGFARAQVEDTIARGDIHPSRVQRGIADQIALASRISPTAGSRRLNTARILRADLPGVRGLLVQGRVSEDLAAQVVSEIRHLSPELRRQVDAQIVAARVEDLNPRQAALKVRDLAYQADKAAYVQRGRTARKDRRVTLRPAPDTMAVLSALVPVEQGVAALAALRRHADATVGVGDEPRNRDQVMADTLVERLTGQAEAADVNVEVGIVIPVDALIDPRSPATAQVVGHGPIPACLAREVLAGTKGRRWWRRLFTQPAGGPLIGTDPRRRYFDGVLAALIRIRDDDRCRDPYCGAPCRNIDHIHPDAQGGPTSYTNGRGTCVRGNQVKELPGWTAEVVHDGLGDQPHTVRTTTPTGHTYTSRAGP
ncbi:DUF222 domain-containing protein [Pseudonocardia sp. C8]|uniref:HNH endonuclease n=1 Tax=Pseudonocardia sp. C8 TaxID=2762759 RepID=UPI001642CCE7|nr:DUF222 domain-containing protein [Pseudonocardia sp. C8]MBC3193246.1 DUF222 domain-containing protein [Pseudonocardia sp. C8]